ncbi:MAG: hypothetical protein EZS28_003180 [Streblomastix strix]|uniref:Uncharacterized protein n=1 Tax=Streblomastix strix TaxID=222440 RepID=A0A5J4X3F7_9EUKA|nr:MAG: hypothetical protein EZS28_003180 [Streblomastix strix]
MTEDTQDVSQFDSTIIPMTESKKEIIDISLTEIDRLCTKYFKQLKVRWICGIILQYCPNSIKPGNFRQQIHNNCETLRQHIAKKYIRLYKIKEDKIAELEQYVEDEPNEEIINNFNDEAYNKEDKMKFMKQVLFQLSF